MDQIKKNPKVENIISHIIESFTEKPKFDDLADYLPFLCAFGAYDFTIDHINALKEKINSENLIDFDENKIYKFSTHYEIILGLIEVYRLTRENDILDLAVKITDASIDKFIWRNGIVSSYHSRWHLPSLLISFYNYSFVELMLDVYEETYNSKYLEISKKVLYDAVNIPFYRKYNLFPMADYLIFRQGLFYLRPPHTSFMGKNSSILFGMIKFAELSDDAFIKESAYKFLDAVWSSMVEDGIIYRSYQPHIAEKSSPNLAAAFMYTNMLNSTYEKFRREIHLDRSKIITDKWLTQQSNLGLFPFEFDGNRSWLDSETDMSISLLELYELTGEEEYYKAAARCYQGILDYNLTSSSVNIDTGTPTPPVLFRSQKPTPKFMGLFLKLAYYFESGKQIYGENGIENLIRDR